MYPRWAALTRSIPWRTSRDWSPRGVDAEPIRIYRGGGLKMEAVSKPRGQVRQPGRRVIDQPGLERPVRTRDDADGQEEEEGTEYGFAALPDSQERGLYSAQVPVPEESQN